MVIDAACGDGYGAEMLAGGGAERVDGFNLSVEAIRAARKRDDTGRLYFEVADVRQLPVADQAYDVYVSLKTIEHVADEHVFLREACRVLKPYGRFICSTPNRVLTNPGTSISDRPFNRYHEREYTLGEFESLLRPYFSTTTFCGQSCYGARYARFLDWIGQKIPIMAVRLHQARKVLGIPWEKIKTHYPLALPAERQPEVLIAVCTR